MEGKVYRSSVYFPGAGRHAASVYIDEGEIVEVNGKEYVQQSSGHMEPATVSWRPTKAEAQIEAAVRIEKIIHDLWEQAAKLRQEASGEALVTTS